MASDINNFSGNEQELIRHILQAVKNINYGYVEIIIQNYKVVQIDKTEKIRFDGQKTSKTGGDRR